MILVDAYSMHALGIINSIALMARKSNDKLIVNCYQSDPELISALKDLGIDYFASKYSSLSKDNFRDLKLIVSIFARRIIPKWLLNHAILGGINIHPSLLPKHRGCFAIPWAIISGDNRTGLTIHTMEEEIDTGYLLYQNSWEINPSDTAFSLHSKFLNQAFQIYPSIISDYFETKYHLNDCIRLNSKDKAHPRQLPHQGLIDNSWELAYKERFIRAMYYPPFAPAKCDGEPIYFLDQLGIK